MGELPIRKQKRLFSSYLYKFLPFVGIVIFIYLIIKVHPGQIFSLLSTIKLKYLFLIPFPIFLIMAVKSLKWRYILATHGINYPFIKSLKVYFIGFFASFITPGKIGDIIRAFYIKRDCKHSIGKSFYTVFIDRLSDIITLLILAAVAAAYLSENLILLISALLLMTLLFLSLLYFLIPQNAKRITFILTLIPKKYRKLADNTMKDFFMNVSILSRNKKAVFITLALSFLTWIFIFLYVEFIGFLVGVNLRPFEISLIWPMITLVEILPISIAGIGTRDIALFYFLNQEVLIGDILGFSLVYLVLAGWSYALIGAILWLLDPIPLKLSKLHKHHFCAHTFSY